MSEETEKTENEETPAAPESGVDTTEAEAPAVETAAEEPVAEAPSEEPAAEETPAVEETPAAAEAPAAPPVQSGPKKKRKILPRAQRPKKGRRVHVPATERKPI